MRVEVEPAHIDRVMRATDGRIVFIDADVGGIAESLRRLDPCLRLAHNPDVDECWIVYRCHRDGRPISPEDRGPGASHELVGTYRELDHRIIRRLEFIDSQGRGGYDYVKALDERNRRAERERQHEFQERVGEMAERTAFHLRKDLGLGPVQGRIFKPRDL